MYPCGHAGVAVAAEPGTDVGQPGHLLQNLPDGGDAPGAGVEVEAHGGGAPHDREPFAGVRHGVIVPAGVDTDDADIVEDQEGQHEAGEIAPLAQLEVALVAEAYRWPQRLQASAITWPRAGGRHPRTGGPR